MLILLIKMLIICWGSAQCCLKLPILDWFRICKFALKPSQVANVQMNEQNTAQMFLQFVELDTFSVSWLGVQIKT